MFIYFRYSEGYLSVEYKSNGLEIYSFARKTFSRLNLIEFKEGSWTQTKNVIA